MTTCPADILNAIKTGKVAGSWLITGGNNDDKKSFILRCCSELLNQNINNSEVFHPDIKWLECGLTEEAKKEVQKAILAGKAVEDGAELPKKREITVDDVRQGIQFLSLKSGESRWRVLILNPADKMNDNAANALLKMLEEPGERCVIFLLCQNMGKLLPTIRSRCRILRLRPLPPDELAKQLKADYPMLDDVDTLVHLAGGSPGMAREILEHDGIAIYQKMMALFVPAEQLSAEDVKAFAADMAEDEVGFGLMKKFMSDIIVAQARQAAGTAPFRAEAWMDLYDEINRLWDDIDRIYLDKKQVIQTVFFKIAEVLS